MTEEPQRAILCPNWPPPKKVPGARRTKCEDCGQPVAVSPSSLPILRQGGRIVCNLCGLAGMMRAAAEGETVRMIDHLGKDREPPV